MKKKKNLSLGLPWKPSASFVSLCSGKPVISQSMFWCVRAVVNFLFDHGFPDTTTLAKKCGTKKANSGLFLTPPQTGTLSEDLA